MPTSTQDIYNYRRVNDTLITGGQPTAEQLQAAADEGVATVINLATGNQREPSLDEAGLVRSLGMQYYHIPVAWDNPTAADFLEFERVMAEAEGKTLLHCAANFRVTAFYSLYALKRLGWSEAEADAFRASIWRGSDYPVWEAFVEQMKSDIQGDRAAPPQ
ncbi:MAG: protein tyrosine phosphatase family protein [Anaerolineae bacterium]